jgi:hypothetical protein
VTFVRGCGHETAKKTTTRDYRRSINVGLTSRERKLSLRKRVFVIDIKVRIDAH